MSPLRPYRLTFFHTRKYAKETLTYLFFSHKSDDAFYIRIGK